MIYLLLIIIGFGAFEISKLAKQNLRKEIIIWLSFAVLTIVFAIYYYNVQYEISLSQMIMDAFDIDY